MSPEIHNEEDVDAARQAREQAQEQARVPMLNPWTRAFLAGMLSLVLPGAGSFYLGKISTAFSAAALVSVGSLAAALLWRLGLFPGGALLFALGFISLGAHLGSAVMAMRESLQLHIKRPLLTSLAFMLFATLLMLVTQDLSRRFVMATYAVATISMEPTLNHGDRVLVRPQLWSFAARRGDIVAMHDEDKNQDFVRRLIALPGDRVQIKGAHLVVNEQPLDDGPCRGKMARIKGCFMEKSPDGLRYPVVDRMGTGDMDLKLTVSEGHFFVLRDRRDMHLPLAAISMAWMRGVVADVWWSYIGEEPQLQRVGLHVAPEQAGR